MLRQEMLDGQIGGSDDILPRFLVMDLEPAGPVHERARLADNVDDLLDGDCHSLLLMVVEDKDTKKKSVYLCKA